MSIISDILSGGVSGLLSSVGQFAKDIREVLTGEVSVEKKAEIIQKAQEMEFASAQAQVAVNLEEAKHPNIFVAGWRPFIGWVCGAALAYNYIFMPFIAYFLRVFYPNVPSMPALDMGELITILFALLGIGGMRSVEKIRGVQEKH